MIQYSLLDEPIISTIDRATQKRSGKSLPAVLAALVRDEIDDFPALRPHQRHVWHAFLVQLAAIYLHRSGTTAVPDAAGATDWGLSDHVYVPSEAPAVHGVPSNVHVASNVLPDRAVATVAGRVPE